MNPRFVSIPPTTRRVERNTADRINDRIEQQTVERVARVIMGGRDAMSRRLYELDREWDIERALEANASMVSLATLALGFLVHRKFFRLTALVAAFLLQHAVQGWCPPVPLLRRAGFRTSHEIEIERTALRLLRGDFKFQPHDADSAVAQARLA